MWRGRFIQKIKFTRSDGFSISAGSVTKGDHFRLTLTEELIARNFQYCTVENYPFSAIVGISVTTVNLHTGERARTLAECLTPNPLNLDYHSHFDPLLKYGQDYKRLSAIEIITVKKQIVIEEGDEEFFGVSIRAGSAV